VAVPGGHPQKVICAETAVLLFSSQRVSLNFRKAIIDTTIWSSNFIPAAITQIEEVVSIVMSMPRSQPDLERPAKKARVDAGAAKPILCTQCGSRCQEGANPNDFDTMLCTSCDDDAPAIILKPAVVTLDFEDEVDDSSSELALRSSSARVATLEAQLKAAQNDVAALQTTLGEADTRRDDWYEEQIAKLKAEKESIVKAHEKQLANLEAKLVNEMQEKHAKQLAAAKSSGFSERMLLDKLSSRENDLVALRQKHKAFEATLTQQTSDFKVS